MSRRLPTTLLFCILLFGGGCSSEASGPDSDAAISRELFVETYFRLRAAALANPGQEIRPAERDRILQEQGVTQEDLFTFVEVWGTEPAFMEAIWDEIEDRMRRTRDDPDPEEFDPRARPGMADPEGRDPGGDPPPRPPGGPGSRGGG